MFLGKWKSHTRMAQPSEKFRWKKSMACPCFLHRVFSKAVQPSMKVVVGVYINDFFLAVEYANKIVRQIKEWCFFWSVSLQPTKEALFLMPYYWDMKGWRATVLCRLDCAIKMELRVVAIKVSRCQHGKQRKVLGSIVLKHFKAYRQGFSCRAIVGGSLSEVRGLSFFDDGWLLYKTHERMRICKRNRPFKNRNHCHICLNELKWI